MKSLNFTELQYFAESLQSWSGAELQDFFVQKKRIGLCLWRDHKSLWLVFDLVATSPLALQFADRYPLKINKKEESPLRLFMKANLKGREFLEAKVQADFGRVLRLGFSGAEIEVRLFPHGQNFFVRVGSKKMSWAKPKELAATATHEESIEEVRNISFVAESWLEEQKENPAKTGSGVDYDKKRRQELKKLRRAEEKILAGIEEKSSADWQGLGQWLLTHQSLSVPEKWQKYIDAKESFAENAERAFKKAKEKDKKLAGAQARLEETREKIRLFESTEKPERLFAAPAKKSAGLLGVAKAKGRTLRLSSELEAYSGKSAKDNVALLRKARAWDLWLHVKDIPGSYGIVRRNKKAVVSDEQLRQVAEWVLGLQFGDKAKARAGEPFEFLVAECRYVRPIKGDKLGRVTFQNERVLRVRL